MKKLISILLTLCMLMVFVPTAYAASTPPDFSDGWTALTSEDGGKEFIDGNYYLSDDITIDYCLTFLGNVVLDLNGHVIKLNSELYGGTADNCILKIVNNAYSGGYYTTNFILQDSNPTAKHYFSKQSDGTWKWDPTITEATEGYELVEGGVITGGTGGEPISGTSTGGGILIYAQSATDTPKPINVTINGGNIVDCKAKNGGGIGNWYGTVTMNAGNIIGCVANDRGGGIYNYSGTFNINGGNIIGCVTNTSDGGGIYVNKGNVTVDGGNIKGCVAAHRGGGVYSANDGNFTLNSGKIENCSADEGGGVCGSSTFTMNGGSIENCVATEYDGGGVKITCGNFKMKGGIIKNCTATKHPESNAYRSYDGAKLFADGGVIDDTAYIDYPCSITRSDDAKGTTVFNEKVTYDCNIEAGIFYVGLEKDGGYGAIVGNTYTVTFYANSTDTEPFATALVVGDGTILVPPTMSEREGYTLVWYTEGGDEYTFDSAVDSDFSLYAKFVQVDSGENDTNSDLPAWLDILLSLLKLVFKILVDKGIF